MADSGVYHRRNRCVHALAPRAPRDGRGTEADGVSVLMRAVAKWRDGGRPWREQVWDMDTEEGIICNSLAHEKGGLKCIIQTESILIDGKDFLPIFSEPLIHDLVIWMAPRGWKTVNQIIEHLL